MSHSSIILMGPFLSGKSTVRRLLADALKLPDLTLSPFEGSLWQRYYNACGWDQAVAGRLFCAEGFDGLYGYMKDFEACALERCLSEHPNHIIELSATQSVYEDWRLLSRVREVLGPYPNVVLLLPSPNPAESHQELRSRYWNLIDIDLNAYFVDHPSNYELATSVIYTRGQTPQATCDDILDLIKSNDSFDSDVVLIGPPCAGKTTLAALLSIRLRCPHYSLDNEGWKYYGEAGYDASQAKSVREQGGFGAFVNYMQPFAAHAVERFLGEHQNYVADFGAAHSVYDDRGLFERVARALARCKNVLLILPSGDREESLRILRERPRMSIGGVDAILYVIDFHLRTKLAKRVVYTHDKRPDETADEIIRSLVL